MEDSSFKEDVPENEAVADTPTAMLGSLLSNPELLQKLGGILGSMSASATSQKEKTPIADTATVSAPQIGDGLSALLSNPEMMARLPQMIALLKPMMEAGSEKKEVEAASFKPTAGSQSREHLLLALKPFLSKERCDAVDTILRISQLGDVLGRLK